MLPAGDGAGALEQPGQHGEDARREAAGGRRLAGRQADLALGQGDPGQAVHHQDDVAAGVAEPLGDPGRDERRPQPHDRGLVGGGDDDDRAGQALGAEVVLEELADLAAALADQRDHRDLGVGAAGDHREQAGLADAGAGHDAEALAAAARRSARRGRGRRGRAAGRSGGGSAARGRLVVDDDLRQVRRATVRRRCGRPRPSSTRPRSSSPTAIRRAAPACRDVVAGPQPGGGGRAAGR